MIKSLTFALAAACTQAANRTVLVDPIASTKTEGFVAWQTFYDFYMDGLYAGEDNKPANFNNETHLCYWRWSVTQPFNFAGDNRFSLAVVHSCPVEFIASIEFNLTVTSGSDYVIVDNDTDRADIDGGVRVINLKAKTQRGEGAENDFGYWNDLDTEPVWTYFYKINYAAGDENIEQDSASVFIVTRTNEPFQFFDESLTAADVVGVDDDRVEFHRENLRNPIISSDLKTDGSSLQIASGIIQVPDEFLKEGKVFISQIEVEQARYFNLGAGCRRFVFSNGVSTFSTELLGVNCGFDHMGEAIADENVLLDIEQEVATYRFHEGIYDYSKWRSGYLGQFTTGNVYLSWLSFVEFLAEDGSVLGADGGEHSNAIFQDDHVVTQHLCGIQYNIQAFFDQQGDTAMSTYINWRPLECSIALS